MEWAQGSSNDSESTQRSPKWHDFRGKGIGGSEAAILLGWSPYKNISDFFLEKTGRQKSLFSSFQLSAMNRGRQLEPEIRRFFEKETGFAFPDAIAVHPEYSFMRCSLDGLNKEFPNPDGTFGRILEIKTANAQDHGLAKIGEVPKKYLPQLNHMGFVTGVTWFSYVSFGSDDTYAVVNLRADLILQDEILRRSQLFWDYLQRDVEPDPSLFRAWVRPLSAPIDLPREEHPQIVEQEIEKLVAEALSLQAAYQLAETKFEAAKINLKTFLKAAGVESLERGEASFGWQTRKGTIDYSAIPELEKVNLEKYRKEEIKAFYFKRKV